MDTCTNERLNDSLKITKFTVQTIRAHFRLNSLFWTRFWQTILLLWQIALCKNVFLN